MSSGMSILFVYNVYALSMICLVLDSLRSAHNVGSFFRSADCFAIDQIFLTGITPTPLTHDFSKTALGAEFSVNWRYYADSARLFSYLENLNYKIIVIELTEAALPLWQLVEKLDSSSQNLAIVFGAETTGVSQFWLDRADLVFKIPMLGLKESLNVAVVCGIVLYELRRNS